MKRAFLYVRVSTQEQAKEGYSIDEQIDRLKNYCKAMHWSIVDTYVDAGFSGAKTDRPALQSMLRDIKDGKGDIVCVYKLDRLSRSQKDTLSLIEDNFIANGVDFVSMTENFDTSTPFGRAMIGILSVFAQLEREQIKERMKMGKMGRSKEGKWKGGLTPVGYEYINGTLVINEYEAMQIREIHELYQKGNGFHEIVRRFDAKGYAHRYGKWTVKRVRDAMLNETYLGKIHHKGELLQGIHEPIIDEKIYKKTLDVYNSHDYKQKGKHLSRVALLGGLIYCSKCGARYGYYNYGGNKYRYYACYSRRRYAQMSKADTCDNHIWKAEELENLIIGEIQKLADDPTCIHGMRTNSESLESQNKTLILEREIEKINSQKSRFMDLYGLGEFTAQELTAKIAPLNERRQALEHEISLIQSDDTALSEDEAVKIVRSFSDVLERGDFNETKILIQSLVEKVEIDGQNVDIFWKFA